MAVSTGRKKDSSHAAETEAVADSSQPHADHFFCGVRGGVCFVDDAFGPRAGADAVERATPEPGV
jgi:hypothetical protein